MSDGWVHYTVLYTRQKTKKSKTWHDGLLKVSTQDKRAVLFDDKNVKLDTIYVRANQVACGVDLESDHYLVTVEEQRVGGASNQNNSQQIQPVVAPPVTHQREDDRPLQKVVQSRYASSNPQVDGISKPKVAPRFPTAKRKRVFIPPRVVKQQKVEHSDTAHTSAALRTHMSGPTRGSGDVIRQQPPSFAQGQAAMMSLWTTPGSAAGGVVDRPCLLPGGRLVAVSVGSPEQKVEGVVAAEDNNSIAQMLGSLLSEALSRSVPHGEGCDVEREGATALSRSVPHGEGCDVEREGATVLAPQQLKPGADHQEGDAWREAEECSWVDPATHGRGDDDKVGFLQRVTEATSQNHLDAEGGEDVLLRWADAEESEAMLEPSTDAKESKGALLRRTGAIATEAKLQVTARESEAVVQSRLDFRDQEAMAERRKKNAERDTGLRGQGTAGESEAMFESWVNVEGSDHETVLQSRSNGGRNRATDEVEDAEIDKLFALVASTAPTVPPQAVPLVGRQGSWITQGKTQHVSQPDTQGKTQHVSQPDTHLTTQHVSQPDTQGKTQHVSQPDTQGKTQNVSQPAGETVQPAFDNDISFEIGGMDFFDDDSQDSRVCERASEHSPSHTCDKAGGSVRVSTELSPPTLARNLLSSQHESAANVAAAVARPASMQTTDMPSQKCGDDSRRKRSGIAAGNGHCDVLADIQRHDVACHDQQHDVACHDQQHDGRQTAKGGTLGHSSHVCCSAHAHVRPDA
ncbi:PREDICTED: uncharacterized protein LOC106805289 [Priapulus caudatus]|uniref:Uncharacterized protein LOC106805289 n=1 Tax=Priapulus caudatus TaxID=37621 RepID=A0ABM1DQU2_PRICU|nr:PREDICTED: uncharacterized protein LOC106805289 [Priapulus caudatus]